MAGSKKDADPKAKYPSMRSIVYRFSMMEKVIMVWVIYFLFGYFGPSERERAGVDGPGQLPRIESRQRFGISEGLGP